MFHIGVVELALTCGLILLVFFIPLILSRFYARLDKRLKNIEKKLDNKKQQ
jgi:hypothetical protein